MKKKLIKTLMKKKKIKTKMKIMIQIILKLIWIQKEIKMKIIFL